MNKVFCVSCGFKLFYEVNKPKFCSNCGLNINTLKASVKEESKSEGEFDLPPANIDVDVEQLKKSVAVEYDKEKQTLGSMWGSITTDEASAPPSKFARPKFQGPKGQELLDQTIKDCGSSRSQDLDV